MIMLLAQDNRMFGNQLLACEMLYSCYRYMDEKDVHISCVEFQIDCHTRLS
jgi:hypothetical protein